MDASGPPDANESSAAEVCARKMFASAEVCVPHTGKAIARFGTKSQGQGHETAYAQVIAEELGVLAGVGVQSRRLLGERMWPAD